MMVMDWPKPVARKISLNVNTFTKSCVWRLLVYKYCLNSWLTSPSFPDAKVLCSVFLTITTLLSPLWNSWPWVVLGILLRSMIAEVGSGRTTEDLPGRNPVVSDLRLVDTDNIILIISTEAEVRNGLTQWPPSLHRSDWISQNFTGLSPFPCCGQPCPGLERKYSNWLQWL